MALSLVAPSTLVSLGVVCILGPGIQLGPVDSSTLPQPHLFRPIIGRDRCIFSMSAINHARSFGPFLNQSTVYQCNWFPLHF